MGRINIEALAQRERCGIIVDGRIRRGIMYRYWSIGEASDELLNVAYAERARSGGAKV